jgi:2-iminoacetate synthase
MMCSHEKMTGSVMSEISADMSVRTVQAGGFYEVVRQLQDVDVQAACMAADGYRVRQALAKDTLSPEDFLALLSPAARPYMESMAHKARDVTVRQFGRTIQLFTPLYLSNWCTNRCVYCSFNACSGIDRMQLDAAGVLREGQAIAATGLRHLLLLTGEAPAKASVDYIRDCVRVLRPLFPSLSIEVYALTEPEYRTLAVAGVDGMTLFQETYNEALYPSLHPAGPKSNYHFRLGAPERACRAGMRNVNIGALLGLDQWQRDAFMTGMHALWLQHRYPGVDIAVSLPRMRPYAGSFQPVCDVDDRALVQIMLAMRLFLPRCGITISTRERPAFRDNLIPLGVTRMSAGVSTAVGGHAENEHSSVGQFEISDPRSVDEVVEAVSRAGYQAVFKDWHPLEDSCAV